MSDPSEFFKTEWPTRGPDFNPWHMDAAAFVAMIQANPGLWLGDMNLKYLNVRIDTRSGDFIVTARDGERVSPDRVTAAAKVAARDGANLAYRDLNKPPSLPSPSAPGGWQLVPIEPTEAMLEAGEDTFASGYTGTPISTPADVYAAMLSSSPPAPQGSGDGWKTKSIVTCAVTGAIPGDGGACGDCDPCIMGEASAGLFRTHRPISASADPTKRHGRGVTP